MTINEHNGVEISWEGGKRCKIFLRWMNFYKRRIRKIGTELKRKEMG